VGDNVRNIKRFLLYVPWPNVSPFLCSILRASPMPR